LPLCDQPDSSHTGHSTTKVAAQQGYERPDGALTLTSHSNADVVGHKKLRAATHRHFRWSA
jgi:hypothetical protein